MVEIVLATYNGEKYIKEQLESLVNQSYQEFKILVRDDGSTDRTVEILRAFAKRDKRIKVIEDEKGNLGYAENFFELLRLSRAEYVLLCDQDDVWMGDKIEKMVKVANFELQFMEKKEPLLIHHDVTLVDEDLKGTKWMIQRKGIVEGIDKFFFQNLVQSAAMMINRPLINMLKNRPNTIQFHDKYIHIMAELFGKRGFVPESLMLYRQHGNNSVGTESFTKKREKFKKNQGKVFLEWEREAFLFILRNFKLKEEDRVFINSYLFITDMTVPKKERLKMLKRSKIYMPFKKRVAMKYFGK